MTIKGASVPVWFLAAMVLFIVVYFSISGFISLKKLAITKKIVLKRGWKKITISTQKITAWDAMLIIAYLTAFIVCWVELTVAIIAFLYALIMAITTLCFDFKSLHDLECELNNNHYGDNL